MPTGGSAITTVAVYTAVRLALLAAVTAVLVLAGVPLLVAAMIAVVASLALSFVLFRGMRARLGAAVLESRSRRNAERARLRASLRGEGPDSG